MASASRSLLPWKRQSPAKKFLRQLLGLVGYESRFRIGTSVMKVPQDMTWAFFDNGDYYERNIACLIEEMLKSTKGMVLYDVGANYGYYCLKNADIAKQIYAFEPVTRTRDILLKNVRNNGIHNVTVFGVGISDKTGNAAINLYSTSGSSSLFDSVDYLPMGHEIIKLVTLDGFIKDEKINPPDVIKLDIEGGELFALYGARETIKQFRPVLILEYVEQHYREAGYSRPDVLRELAAASYEVYGIPLDPADTNIYPLEMADKVEVENIIAFPPID